MQNMQEGQLPGLSYLCLVLSQSVHPCLGALVRFLASVCSGPPLSEGQGRVKEGGGEGRKERERDRDGEKKNRTAAARALRR